MRNIILWLLGLATHRRVYRSVFIRIHSDRLRRALLGRSDQLVRVHRLFRDDGLRLVFDIQPETIRRYPNAFAESGTSIVIYHRARRHFRLHPRSLSFVSFCIRLDPDPDRVVEPSAPAISSGVHHGLLVSCRPHTSSSERLNHLRDEPR